MGHTCDFVVRDLLTLIHSLESSESLQEEVPRFSVFLQLAQLLSWVHSGSLYSNDTEVTVVRLIDSA